MAVSISLKAVAVLGLMRFGCVYSAGNSTSQGMDDEEDGNTTRRMTPVSCPSTHPYAYYTNNAYCCKTDREKVNTPQGEACDGSSMHVGGKTSLCCEDDQYTPCPGASCRNFYQAPTSCPSTHPYVYHTNNAYCCKTNKEKNYTSQGEACDGSSMHAGGKTSLCCEGDQHTPCPGTSCKNFHQDPCTTGSGTACRTCESPLTGNNGCQSCNPGHLLDWASKTCEYDACTDEYEKENGQDLVEQCRREVRLGYCDTHVDWMKTHCKWSCDPCKVNGGGRRLSVADDRLTVVV